MAGVAVGASVGAWADLPVSTPTCIPLLCPVGLTGASVQRKDVGEGRAAIPR